MEMKGSLIIVLTYRSPPYFATLIEVDLNEWPEKPTGPNMGQGAFKVVARLKQGGDKFVEGIYWKVCSLPPAVQTQTGGPNLCVFPALPPWLYTQLSGYIFNLGTRTMEKLKPHASPKLLPNLVSLNGYSYYFPDTACLVDEPYCFPERYCHEKNTWETLKHSPLPKDRRPGLVAGYAAYDDDNFILFNMQNCSDRELLAYDCSSGNWYPVTVKDDECYGFFGVGVVVETTLYAVTRGSSSILALSITRKKPSGEFSCRLVSKFDLSQCNHPRLVVHEPSGIDHLVHFRDLEFFLVRTGYSNHDWFNQELKTMLLRLEKGQEGQNLATLIHAMDYKTGIVQDFSLCYCFFLPPGLDLVASKVEEDGSDDIDIAFDIDCDLDLVASKVEDGSDDIDFAFDIKKDNQEEEEEKRQNVNPALEAETATLPKVEVGNERRRKGRGRRGKKKSGKSKSCGGDNGEGSRSQI